MSSVHLFAMALQADQLPMRGLQLDESTRQKLEFDMREVRRGSILCVWFVVSFSMMMCFSLSIGKMFTYISRKRAFTCVLTCVALFFPE